MYSFKVCGNLACDRQLYTSQRAQDVLCRIYPLNKTEKLSLYPNFQNIYLMLVTLGLKGWNAFTVTLRPQTKGKIIRENPMEKTHMERNLSHFAYALSQRAADYPPK